MKKALLLAPLILVLAALACKSPAPQLTILEGPTPEPTSDYPATATAQYIQLETQRLQLERARVEADIAESNAQAASSQAWGDAVKAQAAADTQGDLIMAGIAGGSVLIVFLLVLVLRGGRGSQPQQPQVIMLPPMYGPQQYLPPCDPRLQLPPGTVVYDERTGRTGRTGRVVYRR